MRETIMMWLGILLGVTYFAWIPLSCWLADKNPYVLSDFTESLLATATLAVAGGLASGSMYCLVTNEWVWLAALWAGVMGYAAGFHWVSKRWWNL